MCRYIGRSQMNWQNSSYDPVTLRDEKPQRKKVDKKPEPRKMRGEWLGIRGIGSKPVSKGKRTQKKICEENKSANEIALKFQCYVVLFNHKYRI